MTQLNTQMAGFVGSYTHKQKQTKFGVRPVTTIKLGVRDKATKRVAWNYVNVFGTAQIERGDILRLDHVKAFGRTHYGKIAAHQPRNKRDRQATGASQPRQLALPL